MREAPCADRLGEALIECDNAGVHEIPSDRMRPGRRALLGAAAAAALAPRAVWSQKPDRVFRLGWLTSGERSRVRSDVDRSLATLAQAGFQRGENLVFEWRAAGNEPERLDVLAAELAAMKLEAILAGDTEGALALRRATSTTPIVAIVGPDPVAEDVVASLLRPGGNVTGVTTFSVDAAVRRYELLKELFPTRRRVRFMTQQDAARWIESETRGAATLGLRVDPFMVEDVGDLERFFGGPLRRDETIYVASTKWNALRMHTIVSLANRARAAIIYPSSEFAEAGGLIACAADQRAALERATEMVLRVLKGAKPGEIPLERSTRVSIVINRRTAKENGVRISPEVLARADRLIE